MNPITLGKAIADVGVPIITAIMLILVVGLVWYLIKRQTNREDKHDVIQKEERLFYRTLVTNDMKELHLDSLKNAELNQKSIGILEKHSTESRVGNLKLTGILKNLLKLSNGNNPAIKGLISRMDIYDKREGKD